MATGIAAAQNPAAPAPPPGASVSAPDGYKLHQSFDVGGHMNSLIGSGAMYDTMVNQKSGPRVLGETFELRALPDNKKPLVDDLKAFSNGFGGDPINFAKLDFSKAKVYEFSGMFRRDRRYFDYDLLGNPNIPSGQTMPIGPTATPTGTLAWPQLNTSAFLFNTVRRMTDTSLTLLPLSRVTFRASYSHNNMEGPSLSPSGYQIAGSYDLLLQEYQRHSTDDFTGAIDWKPVQGTRLTFEEQVDHYKGNSFFTLASAYLTVQEADGTKVALLANYDALTPYTSSSCVSTSMGSSPMLTANSGGLPIINPACAVSSSYLRTQPTRAIFPTEILRLQSTSIKNISMNGEFRYTEANMNLPSYYDYFQGLSKTTRSIAYAGVASAKRQAVAADYGIVWQVTPKLSLSEQIAYSVAHQPGTTTMTSGTTVSTPTDTSSSTGNETINNLNLTSANAAAGASTFEGSGNIGAPLPDYFGQKFVTNNLTATWDATARSTFSLTYRYRTHVIGEGIPNNTALTAGATNNGTVTINENGGIFNAALRPANNWDLNGTVEVLYDDNAFTPMGARQTKHYRVHTLYRPRTWATISGAYNDLERHNNTNNSGSTPIDGPLDHVDHSRVFSAAADLAPNEHVGIDFDYAYSDVYLASNICFLNGATATLPGAATLTSSGTANICPGAYARGSTTNLDEWEARNFMDAPTQSGSASLSISPNTKVRSNLGYRISSVNGSRFFNDARDVNGSLVSKYQTPYFNIAWTVRPGWIWRAEYNYFSYGEGGPSGAPLCSTAGSNLSASTPVVACNASSLGGAQTGLTLGAAGETLARDFRANNVTLGMHWEF
ncbi:MAG: hypothetical protein ACLQKY_17585 [Terracidiphilus sp.]